MAEKTEDTFDIPFPISTGEPNFVENFFASEFRTNEGFPPQKNPTARSIEELLEACLAGDVEKVRHTLFMRSLPQSSISIDLNHRFPGGYTILMLVCQKPCDSRHLFDDIIRMLIKNNKGSVHARNDLGDTAMNIAIRYAEIRNGQGQHQDHLSDQVCKVRTLIGFGAAVNAQNDPGITPLMVACEKNRCFIANVLLENGADTGAVTVDGRNPFDFARGNRRCEEALKKRDAEIHRKFHEALNLVIPRDNFEILPVRNQQTGQSTGTINVFFPLHCYSMRESSLFRVFFDLDSDNDPPKPTPEATPVLAIGKVRFGGIDQVRMLFWGTTPVKNVVLNGVHQSTVSNTGNFLYTCWPLQRGRNDLTIQCEPNCSQSQYKLVIGAVVVKVIKKKV